MRKVVQYSLMSLDGVAENPATGSPRSTTCAWPNLGHVIGEQDTVLLGRHSYDDWAGYWPTADAQPFADFVNPVQVVFTSSKPEVEWTNTTVVDSPMIDFVRDLKRRAGRHHRRARQPHVGAARCAPAGLVDELELVIFPTVAGAGAPVRGGEAAHNLELAASRRTPSGALLATYRVTSG